MVSITKPPNAKGDILPKSLILIFASIRDLDFFIRSIITAILSALFTAKVPNLSMLQLFSSEFSFYFASKQTDYVEKSATIK